MVVAIQQSHNKKIQKGTKLCPLPWSAIVCSTCPCSYALKPTERGRGCVRRGVGGGEGGWEEASLPLF